MKRLIAFLLAAVLGGSLGMVSAAAFEVMQVADETMAETYRKGDRVLIDRMVGREKNFDRGDVVLFENTMYTETGEGEIMMKRIVGLPGEWVSIVDGIVHIDGQPLDETAYIAPENRFDETRVKQFVDAGQYFVLGDNRKASTDSRSETVGLVKEEDIQGKVIE